MTTPRRKRATGRLIEDYIAAAQSKGLTPSGISHDPDGRVTIHFEDKQNVEVKKNKNPRQNGWVIPR